MIHGNNQSKEHHIKVEREYFKAVERGEKKFELRLNDRDYQVGDTVRLKEVVGGTYTGRELPVVKIKYVLKGVAAQEYGLKPGYCIFNW